MAPLDAPLRTSRLELRPIAVEDVDGIWPYVSDPELPRHMAWEAHRDRGETARFIAGCVRGRAPGTETDFVWLLRHEGAACGLIGLERVVRTQRAWRHDSADLGYWCAPPFQGRGFMTEAAREVLRFGFADLGLHKITVGCVSENARSLRVIAKLGFRLIGEQREHFFRDGRWWNHLVFELLRADWDLSTRVAL